MRYAQSLLTTPDISELDEKVRGLDQRARRLIEALVDDNPLSIFRFGRPSPQNLVRIMNDVPLYDGHKSDYDCNNIKQHLALTPRKSAVPLKRPVGVFIHLYHSDLAPLFERYTNRINTTCQIYISTDTEAKADYIRTIFPDAIVQIVPNRGRDMFSKLFAFRDCYGAHDIVLHLHGKKSLHSGCLDVWLVHILDCIMSSEATINRILSMFTTVPQIGIVAPLVYRPLIGAAHWGENYEMAKELAFRMSPTCDLPNNRDLRFPVGSMMWARSAALRPLLDLDLQAAHFPPEMGQLDATVSHALERMLGVSCKATNHRLVYVAGPRNTCFSRFKIKVKNMATCENWSVKASSVFEKAQTVCGCRWLCYTNQRLSVVPLSPDGLTLWPQWRVCRGRQGG